MKQFRTQADDLKDEIRILELAMKYASSKEEFNKLQNKLYNAKSILTNIQ
tara:strand:+ start:439 stop:588 length:150 start_codon:yes stop_codon:yes gene_type:complete